jgi:hypothetical protein
MQASNRTLRVLRWLPAAGLLAMVAVLASCGGGSDGGGPTATEEFSTILTPGGTMPFDEPLATFLATTVGTVPPQGPAETPTPGQPRDPGEAARADLAARFGAPIDDIEVVSSTAMDWPDSCLGVGAAGEVCAQVITPGFEIILAFGDGQFVYHTDQDGRVARFASLDIGSDDFIE